VQERIEAFAARLEYHCKAYPYQWFNFYDFWESGETDA
jgi:predicted LPLAT superfamily acyltransferase